MNVNQEFSPFPFPASTSSSGGSESSGSSFQEAEFVIGDCCNGNGNEQHVPSGCIECVTLVSVPDNHVISQGVNHHCSAMTGAAITAANNAGGLPTAGSS